MAFTLDSQTEAYCRRVAIQIVKELPNDVMKAYVIAAMVYDTVKDEAQRQNKGRIDYLLIQKEAKS